MNRRYKVTVSIVLLFLPFLFSYSAFGQEPCPPSPVVSADATALAGEWFALGEKHVEEGRFSLGQAAFECSYSLVSHPASLMNGALAAQKDNNLSDACRLFYRFFEESDDDAKKIKVEELLEELNCKNDPSLAGTPSSQMLPGQQDGENDSDVRSPLSAEHRVGDNVGENQNRLHDEWDVGKKGNRNQHETSGTQENSNNEKVAVNGVTNIEEDKSLKLRRDNQGRKAYQPLRVSGFAIMSVGGIGLATGLFFQAMASSASIRSNRTEDKDRYERYLRRYNTFQPIAIASFVSGGMLFVTGLTLYLIARKKQRTNNIAYRPRFSYGISPMGIALAGKF